MNISTNKFLVSITTVMAFLFVFSTHAHAQDPKQLVESATNTVLVQIKEKRAELEADQQKLYSLIETEILPYIDMPALSKLVIGKYWRQATDAQKEAFMSEFQGFMIKTYASGIFQYDDQKVSFNEARYSKDKQKAIVASIIESSGKKPIPVEFKLLKQDDGSWKIYNVVADGINLITNFRTSYNEIIARDGMDALIASLAEKNKITPSSN